MSAAQCVRRHAETCTCRKVCGRIAAARVLAMLYAGGMKCSSFAPSVSGCAHARRKVPHMPARVVCERARAGCHGDRCQTDRAACVRDAAAGALVSASNALVRASNALVRAHQEELVHAHQKGSRVGHEIRVTCAHTKTRKRGLFRAAHHNRTTYRCAHHGGVGATVTYTRPENGDVRPGFRDAPRHFPPDRSCEMPVSRSER